MKYCTHCGKEIMDDAVVCTGCGCMVKDSNIGATAAATEGTKRKTQVSLVLGIIGIVFAWLFALVGHITSIIGIIFGLKEYYDSGRITGLTLSIIGEVCAIISSIIGAVAMSGAF